MTPEEIQAIAARVAELMAARGWLPETVRPAPPAPPTAGALPPWAGAAQSLVDVAPVPGKRTQSGPHRPAYDAMTAAIRGAAAGTAASPLPGGHDEAVESRARGRTVTIGISNRHIHVNAADFETLFGGGAVPTADREITQPGQYAAHERVRVVGPGGAIDGVRIVGPVRPNTQVELAVSDCRVLGIEPPVRVSGNTSGSSPVRLEGPAGAVDLPEGAIVAARHLHVSPEDGSRMGLVDGDRVAIVVGSGDRRATLQDVPVRAGTKHATELHLDVDEASAYKVRNGCTAVILGRPKRRAAREALRGKGVVTERDVSRLAAEGETLGYASELIVTPAARDRAKALGIWRENE
jgi:putative phosphotransacetylase